MCLLSRRTGRSRNRCIHTHAASLPAPILGGPGKWNNIDLKRDFSIWFSAHVACTTMAILYAPYTFAIVIAWFHLGAFLILLVFIFIACAPFTLRLPWYCKCGSMQLWPRSTSCWLSLGWWAQADCQSSDPIYGDSWKNKQF